MSPKSMACLLSSALLATPIVHAGASVSAYYSELDGTFSGGNVALPGRSTLFHDVSGSTLTDIGIQAFSDPQTGKVTTVARIAVGGDPVLQGIGLGRLLFAGPADTTFGGGDGRIEHTGLGLTSVIDACQDPSGRIVIAVAVPGANGNNGPKDLGLARFLPDGSLDVAYSADGVARFTLADTFEELDEAINDLACLPGGNYYIGGHVIGSNGSRQGFVAVMPGAGNHDLPVAATTFGISSADLESQVTAIHFNATLQTYVAAVTVLGNTSPDRSSLSHLELVGNTFQQLPYPTTILGSDRCPGLPSPSIRGIDRFADVDYVVTFNYSDNGQRRAAIGRINYGESTLVACQAIPFPLANAAVTPPLVHAGRAFVGLGIAPLNGSPVQSEIRSYVPEASGLGLAVDAPFGLGGVSRWSYAFNSGNANNNRSFVQQLWVDPANRIMAVGTRVWNGNDTDVAVARLGARGIFSSGLENGD